MRLIDNISSTFNGIATRLVREAIVYGLCAVCALVVIILAIQASVLALEPLVGVVYARLIVAAVFALIAVGAVLWLKFAQPSPPRRATAPQKAAARAEAAQQDAPYPQIAMIVEAMMLGYSLSRRPERRPPSKTH